MSRSIMRPDTSCKITITTTTTVYDSWRIRESRSIRGNNEVEFKAPKRSEMLRDLYELRQQCAGRCLICHRIVFSTPEATAYRIEILLCLLPRLAWLIVWPNNLQVQLLPCLQFFWHVTWAQPLVVSFVSLWKVGKKLARHWRRDERSMRALDADRTSSRLRPEPFLVKYRQLPLKKEGLRCENGLLHGWTQTLRVTFDKSVTTFTPVVSVVTGHGINLPLSLALRTDFWSRDLGISVKNLPRDAWFDWHGQLTHWSLVFRHVAETCNWFSSCAVTGKICITDSNLSRKLHISALLGIFAHPVE